MQRSSGEAQEQHLLITRSYSLLENEAAMSEGLNSQIQKIKRMAFGFRNIEHFKTATYFHWGGLDLYLC
ncbi:MAG: transposase [Nitrospira sp.]